MADEAAIQRIVKEFYMEDSAPMRRKHSKVEPNLWMARMGIAPQRYPRLKSDRLKREGKL